MRALALFVLRQGLRRLSTWVYFAVYLTLAFLIMTLEAGGFDFIPAGVFGGGGKVLANSPYTVMLLLTRMGLFGIVVVGGVMGQSIHQDFAHRTHPLFFTAPISRAQYLVGRFLGGFLTLLVVFSSFGLGLWLATQSPLARPEMVGPTVASHYLRPYLLTVLPNLFFTSTLFFGLAALTRHMRPVYIANVVLFVGYLLSGGFLRDLDTKWVAALVDPFGHRVLLMVTEYWTVAEKNTHVVPVDGWFLVNRLLWAGLGAAVFGFTLARFQRTHVLSEGRKETLAEPPPFTGPLTPPAVQRDFRRSTFLRLLPRLTWLDFKETVKNVYFFVIVLAGVLLVVGSTRTLGGLYGTPVYPRTYMLLEVVGGGFLLFQVIVITFYSGELVWRERDAHLAHLHDALPFPDWLPLLSKLGALLGVQVLLAAVVFATCVLVQLSQGYTDIDWGLYAVDLFGFRLLDLWILSVLALAIHVLVDHKYLGYFGMVLFLAASALAPTVGFEHPLYNYGAVPPVTWSDMNGFGPYVAQMVWFRVYWGLVAVALAFVAYLFWVRGTERRGAWRLKRARARARPAVGLGLGVSVLGAAAVGGFIFYNTNILNRFETRRSVEAAQADYERQYKYLEKAAQPRLVSVKVQVDLFPEEPRMRARGTMGLVNKTSEAIVVVYVNLPEGAKVNRLAVAGAERPSAEDPRLGVFTYTLPTLLSPGASAELQFDLELAPQGFRGQGAETRLVENGTFLHNDVLPRLGYIAAYELADGERRAKWGLPPRPRMADMNDLEARRDTELGAGADWIAFDATMSTAPDQIAVAPGQLQREWTENGRRFFHYTSERPLLNYYAFLSARYEVKRDTWKGVAIEVLHHPGHTSNVERMIQAVKDTLDYATANFGPYPHRQVRILEFPRYLALAQSFPGMIAYSEGIGFIAQVDPESPKDVDYPYYVTAHELAHQWWGHQVVPGNVQGAALLSETLPQYTALMVMKKKYGEAHMGRFLRYELDHYLGGRAHERKQEQPLLRVERQEYLHYRKGAVVMYALQDALGEVTVNRALAAYFQKVAGQAPPFTNSPELLAELLAVTPEPLRYLPHDLFERIILYENRALTATSRLVARGQYEVKVTARVRKLEADGQGNETTQPLEDWIEVGVLDEEGQPLFLEKRRVTGEEVEFTARVARRPAKAGVDPLHKLIDRSPEDNTVKVTEP